MHDNFSQQADLYAKYRPRYPQALYDFIFQHLQQRDIAWDCATGSGQVGGHLAEHFNKIYATDISKEQLSYAPEKSNVEYKKVPAEDSGLPSDSFDLITVAQAIHWFDFDGFYHEVNRTAKSGALLAVIGYDIIQVEEQLNPIIKKNYDYAFGKFFGENRRYIDEHYQGIPFPFDEIKSPDFNILYEWSREKLEGYFNSWSAVQKIKEEEGLNPVDDFMNELDEFWQPGEVKKVTFPVFLRLGRITAD